MNLESRTQGTFFIPSRKRKRPSSSSAPAATSLASCGNDIPDGDARRQAAMKKSWRRCHARIQGTLVAMTDGTAGDLAAWARSLPDQPEIPLPYPSLPTALLAASSESTINSIVAGMCQGICSEDQEMGDDDRRPREWRTAAVSGRNATSLDALIKSIVLGFMNGVELEGFPNFPNLVSHVSSLELAPRLVLVLHQIHLIPAHHLSALLLILARYASRLDLVLVLTTLTTPSSVKEQLGSDVLLGLDMRIFEAPDASTCWEAIMTSVYFSLDYNPDILLKAEAFDVFLDAFTRENGSVDCLISMLQYAHLKAFTSPLGVFVTESEDELLLSPSSAIYKRLLSLPSVLRSSIDAASPLLPLLTATDRSSIHASSISLPSPSSLLSQLSVSRQLVHRNARSARLSFLCLLTVRNFLAEIRVSSSTSCLSSNERLAMMSAALRGGAVVGGERTWPANFKLVKLLPSGQAIELATRLLSIEGLEDGAEEGGWSSLLEGLRRIDEEVEEEGQEGSRLAARLSAQFSGRTLDNVVFGEVFVFRHLDDLIKVFLPSPLLATLTGLLAPHSYLGCVCCSTIGGDGLNATHLPDLSILFARYLESGKMINLYDWFESFASVLDQTTASSRAGAAAAMAGDGEEDAQPLEQDEATDEDEKRRERQARFLRAFHELDYLGFLKGTKRKEEHCLKTFFMLGEDEVAGLV